MKIIIRQAEFYPVQILEPESYNKGGSFDYPVADIPDELVERVKIAVKLFDGVQAELRAAYFEAAPPPFQTDKEHNPFSWGSIDNPNPEWDGSPASPCAKA